MIDRRTLTRRTEEQLLQDFDGVGLEQIKMKNLVNTVFRELEEAGTTYVHPTGDGWNHVPATGTTSAGKVLTAGATPGSAAWVTPLEGLENYGVAAGGLLNHTLTIPAQIPSPIPVGFSVYARMPQPDSQADNTLKVNNTNAYPVRSWFNPDTTSTRKWGGNSIVQFIFDGAVWRCMSLQPRATVSAFGVSRLASSSETWLGHVNSYEPAVVTPSDLYTAILRGGFIYAQDTSTTDGWINIKFDNIVWGENVWKVAGCCIHVKAAKASTGPVTVLIADQPPGTKIVKRDGSDVAAGDILAGEIITLIYNGTRWQLMGR